VTSPKPTRVGRLGEVDGDWVWMGTDWELIGPGEAKPRVAHPFGMRAWRSRRRAMKERQPRNRDGS
jgi:hypothetical protein